MTIRGKQMLEQELEKLKAERPAIINAIAEAREHGDLRENAEYQSARERQGLSEARITDIEYKVSMAQVIDVSTMPQTGRAVFGTTVELHAVSGKDQVSYKIVGEDESDVDHNLIAYTAPVAREIIGKEVGDEVHIGEQAYTIKKVLYVA
jgi:transcription elongation factor GreA